MTADYASQKPSSCIGCPLLHEPGPVWAEGDYLHARLAYNAQNPGKEEFFDTDTGKPRRDPGPLKGASGRVFNRQLTEAGISRSDVYITNQVKCLTPNNREPTSAEIEHCRHFYTDELARCKADVVVLAGAVSFRENIGRYSTIHAQYHPSDSVLERMGCVEQRDGRKWIGTIHPAFVMRMVDFRQEAVAHLQKAWSLAGVTIPLPTVFEHPDESVIARHREAARANKLFADDVEAVNIPKDIAEDDYIGDEAWQADMVGYSAIPYEAFILNPSEVYEAWNDIYADPEVIVAEWNGSYDCYHTSKLCAQRNRRFDAMLAHHFLHNIIYKYLKPEGVRYYTNLPYYNRDLETVSRRLYCGMDNIATLLAARKQFLELQDDVYVEDGHVVRGRLWQLLMGGAFEGEPPLMEILPVLERQRRVGARTDSRKALLFRRVLESQVSQANVLITKMLGPIFNWHSPDHVKMLFYGPSVFAGLKTPSGAAKLAPVGIPTWNLPVQYNKKEDKKSRRKVSVVTCDEDARKALRNYVNASTERKEQYKNARIYFDLADFVSGKSKLLEYLDRISPDNRIHAFWKAHGTKSYRLSSTPNFQNFPTWPFEKGLDASMRSIVLPDDDEDLLVSCDFDQIELWTYAAQFHVKWLLDTYESGDYIYGAAYEATLKKPFFKEGLPRKKKNKLESVTDQEILRAKAVPLGFLYGRSGESVAAEYGWRSIEGIRLRNDWYAKNPELPKAHSWISYEMHQKGILRPPPGMKLWFPQPDLQGINCYGQTPAAAMLWTSMILIDREFERRGYQNTRIILSVHDSILFNIGGGRRDPSRVVEVVEEIVKPILTRPVPWLKGFRYRHSTSIGTMWDWKMQDYDEWKGAA